jgi:hypothetical protein
MWLTELLICDLLVTVVQQNAYLYRQTALQSGEAG